MPVTGALRERIATRLARTATPAVAPFGGGGTSQTVVPGGWFGGLLGVAPWWSGEGSGGSGGAGGTPIQGVTNGSPALPGTVGELIMLRHDVTYTAAMQDQIVTLGALGPGDWDCWATAYIGLYGPGPSNVVTSINIAMLPRDPAKGGFSPSFIGVSQGFDVLSGTEQVVCSTPVFSLLSAAPTTIQIEVLTNQTVAGPMAGLFPLTFMARRMR